MKKIKVGDVVQHKAGGPKLLVDYEIPSTEQQKLKYGTTFCCSWYGIIDGLFHDRIFYEVSLVPANE